MPDHRKPQPSGAPEGDVGAHSHNSSDHDSHTHPHAGGDHHTHHGHSHHEHDHEDNVSHEGGHPPSGTGAHHHHHDHDHPDHDHDHPHPSSRTGKIRHGLSEFFGMHSHDHAESLDDALESSETGIRALKISFGVLMATAVVQAAIVWFTGSVALLADTIHNFSDALTAVPLFIAFRLGRRAPTRRYTYGYKRAEDLAGLFVVLMILLSAILAIWESVDRLFNPREIRYVEVLFAAGVIGFLGNELVALYRIRVGRQIGSAALVADGYHARVDGLTSLAVAAGAIFVWFGYETADPIVGIGVGILILRVLWSALKEIYGRIMDAVDPELVSRIEQSARSVPGVGEVTGCRLRWMGHRLHTDLSISVDGSMSVADGHALGEQVKLRVCRDVKFLESALVHLDPDTSTFHTVERAPG